LFSFVLLCCRFALLVLAGRSLQQSCDCLEKRLANGADQITMALALSTEMHARVKVIIPVARYH
jgi:hypothetical protein